MSSSDSADVNSIRTYILIAWILTIVVLAIWVISFVYYFVWIFIVGMVSSMGNPYNPFGGYYLGIGLGYGILFIIMTIPSFLVFRRVHKMKAAIDQEDLDTVKKLNTTGWAIIALIFAGVIPGIMLFLAHSQVTGTRASNKKGVSSDSLDKMVKLKSLLDSGVITKEEFEAQKSALLNPQAKQASGLEDKLTKLKALYDSGTLTESEYNEQKKKLLSDL